MLISDIEQDPIAALKYMERVVNDGPPSGLKFTNNVSLETNPWLCDRVDIDLALCPQNAVKIIGTEQTIISKILGCRGLFIHPDFKKRFSNNTQIEHILTGYPTSSARTICVSSIGSYIKLHYPGILGRVDKSLSEQDIINSVDVTSLLKRAVARGKVSSLLSFFPEESGRVGILENSIFSFTVRDIQPYGKDNTDISYIIPAFSLYGQDYLAPYDDTLLSQLIEQKKDVGIHYTEHLLIPIIDCYLSLLFNEGLQHEMHSQNFLLGFNKRWELSAIILRDIESIQKDMTIRADQQIEEPVNSYPNRCLWRGQINYEEKHSFMFDHKIYDFFISPLLNKIGKDETEKRKCLSTVSAFVQEKYHDQIREYFPKNGKWYKFDDVIVSRAVKRRLFLECDNPVLR